MPTTLAYVTIISAIVAVVLVVARDVPLLHLVLPPDTNFGDRAGVVCCPPILLLLAFGFYSPWLLAAGWIGGLAYFWWIAAWHLRERR